MASIFCESTANPGLLGQLILATVATHAALNSVVAFGIVVDVVVVSCFADLHACNKNKHATTCRAENTFLLNIISFLNEWR